MLALEHPNPHENFGGFIVFWVLFYSVDCNPIGTKQNSGSLEVRFLQHPCYSYTHSSTLARTIDFQSIKAGASPAWVIQREFFYSVVCKTIGKKQSGGSLKVRFLEFPLVTPSRLSAKTSPFQGLVRRAALR